MKVKRTMPKLAEMTDSNDRKIRMKLLHREKEAGRKQAQLGKRSKQGYSGELDIHKTPLSVPTDRHNGCQETDGHSKTKAHRKPTWADREKRCFQECKRTISVPSLGQEEATHSAFSSLWGTGGTDWATSTFFFHQ